MKSARDMFNDRLSDDKTRRGENLTWDERGAWELYRCGWEDGVRNYMEEQAQNSNEDIDAVVMRVAGEIADYCIPTEGGRMTIKAPGLAALKRALLTNLRAENAKLREFVRVIADGPWRLATDLSEREAHFITLARKLLAALSSQTPEANSPESPDSCTGCRYMEDASGGSCDACRDNPDRLNYDPGSHDDDCASLFYNEPCNCKLAGFGQPSAIASRTPEAKGAPHSKSEQRRVAIQQEAKGESGEVGDLRDALQLMVDAVMKSGDATQALSIARALLARKPAEEQKP